MDHLKAILIKFIMVAAVLFLVLSWLYNVSFSDTLWISIVLTLLAYVLGDLLVFRKAGDANDQGKRNMIATISDIVLAFAVIWLMGNSIAGDGNDIISAAIISAVIIGAGEWFFHKYLDRHVFPEKHVRPVSNH